MSTGCRICFRTDKEVRTRLYKDTLYRNFFAAFITKWIPRHVRLCPLCVNIIRQMIEFRNHAHVVDSVMRRKSINCKFCNNTKKKSIQSLSIKKLDNIDIVFHIENTHCDNEKTEICQKDYNDTCSIIEKEDENDILPKDFEVNDRNSSKIVTKERILDNDFEENNCEVIFVSGKSEIDRKESCPIKIINNPEFNIEISEIITKNNDIMNENEMNDQSTSDVTDKNEGRFEKDGFKVVFLSREEQLKEIEDRRKTQNYIGRKFRCESCGLGFLTEDVMGNHMVKHSQKSGNFECDICKQRFSTGAVLTQHILAHRRYLQCIYCSIKVRRPWHCSVHRSKCDIVKKTLVCKYCKKLYSNEHSLNRHLKSVHYNEKKFTCDACKKTFSNKQRLSLHLRTHTGQRPFECPTCARCFTTNSNLNEHKKSVHSEIKDRYYCVECDAHFKMAKSLKRHFMLSSKHAGDGVTK